MSDNQGNSQTNTTATTPNRRSSLAGQTFADLFGTRSARPSFSGTDQANQSNPVNPNPGPVASAAAQAQQRRRMSMTALGIGGEGYGKRSQSMSSTGGSIDESAVEDGDAASSSSPTTPFARRMSFGARALRDVRANGTGAATGASGGAGGGGGTQANDAGYNWADSFRSRAERSSSLSGSPNSYHQRANSVATMQPPPVQQQKPARQNVPDHFQERILKGDFYMD